ncbi:MAG: metallophosphoesterase [Acetatifactor sp.]|nr:metallophosphoesterase [Acetatifactor sp.]
MTDLMAKADLRVKCEVSELKEYKILIVSDSHGIYEGIRQAIERELPFNLLVHCGDIEGNLERCIGDAPAFEVKAVKGNCDYGDRLPPEEEFKAGFCNVFVTHGDKYNVKYDRNLSVLKKAAKEKMADVVLFGHSHCAEIVEDEQNHILLINPGSIGNPRTGAQQSTYATLTITDDYEVLPELKSL